MKWIREIGPGILVAAAFIGPGTVTLCTIAGVSYGYSLIWALILSIFATIFLQELSLRVGLVTKMNVAEVISKSVKSIYFNKFFPARARKLNGPSGTRPRPCSCKVRM